MITLILVQCSFWYMIYKLEKTANKKLKQYETDKKNIKRLIKTKAAEIQFYNL